jgi:hypothetical protein
VNARTIKRLELIKNLIALEERDLLMAQAAELETDGQGERLTAITEAIRDERFGEVARTIDDHLSETGAVQSYEDPELNGLRLEAKALETKLGELQSRKAEVEKEIHTFNMRYQRELGDLIVKILEIRKEQARREVEEDEADEQKQEAYEEAQSDYEEYEQVYEEAQEETLRELSPEKQNELKTAFRQASKRCHPDTVDDNYTDEAAETFRELDEAYQQNDLERVQEITEILEQGRFPGRATEQITDAEHLRAEVNRLRDKVRTARRDIEALEQSDAYRTLSELDDRDAYFANRRERLNEQLTELREDAHHA